MDKTHSPLWLLRCGRSLQTLELRDVVPQKDYGDLVRNGCDPHIQKVMVVVVVKASNNMHGCMNAVVSINRVPVGSLYPCLTQVLRLREAEDTVVAAPSDLPEGLELRLCPRCKVRIEKNEV